MKNHLSATMALVLTGLLAAASELATDEFSEDPYLQYRPPFVRSLPVQILLTGIVLTLTVVLLIHLMFTAQYHWPLAPVNYVLQVSGVTTLLISLIATIHVVLSTSYNESEHWPYMLSYIAVNVPPMNLDEDAEGWSIAERATWMVMNASTSGLIQITHIQFLTLLYPSRLEKQLIFALLGPLAIVAAVMQLIPINTDEDVTYVSTAVRNVCNATLSLLFTIALFIWGLLVNRRQAWRTDGGTAVFGCAALFMALVSTALNFLYVHKEQEYVWLPGLMWAVVLWQSFLGWWWWVGAGSGSGLGGADDVEEKLKREEKREKRRREAREKRMERRKKAKKVWRDVTGVWAFHGRENEEEDADADADGVGTGLELRRWRSTSSMDAHVRMRVAVMPREDGSEHENEHEQEETTRVDASASLSDSGSPPTSSARSIISTASSTSDESLRTLPRALPGAIHRWYANLRRAHMIAARKQAAERVERIREMERNGISSKAARTTWGVSNLLWRSRSFARDEEMDGEDNRNRAHQGEEEYELERKKRRRHEHEEHESQHQDEGEETEHGRRDSFRIGEGEHEDHGESSGNIPESGAHATTAGRTMGENAPVQPHARPRSVWWWGPLWRWRLKDSTSYA